MVRAELESLAARLAIPRLVDDDLAGLEEFIGEMQRCADAGDAHAEALADAGFHKRIIDLSGNATLARVWRHAGAVLPYLHHARRPGADRRRIADEHVPVLDALRARDPALATDVLHHHFEHAAAVSPAAGPTRAPLRPRCRPPIGVAAKPASA